MWRCDGDVGAVREIQVNGAVEDDDDSNDIHLKWKKRKEEALVDDLKGNSDDSEGITAWR